MKSKTNPIVKGTFGRMEIIEDFLPRPEDLVFKKSTKKVTITVDTQSLYFFKEEAKTHHTQYQKMIRGLLDYYTEQQRQLK